MGRKMGPLDADHWLVSTEEKCPACKQKFLKGDYVTLIALGPGNDPEAQERARKGKFYNAVAASIHWDCADPQYKE